MSTVTPKLPPLPSASPRPTTTNNTNNPTNPTETEEDLELKSNQTSLASSYNPQTIGLSDAQKHALQLAAPPKRKQPRDMIRKDPPHPDSLMGKAFACYDTYHAQYVDFMNAADRDFTQIARDIYDSTFERARSHEFGMVFEYFQFHVFRRFHELC